MIRSPIFGAHPTGSWVQRRVVRPARGLRRLPGPLSPRGLLLAAGCVGTLGLALGILLLAG